MRYVTTLTIDLPRAKVLELFDNTQNLKKWQKGLISYEHLSGEPGKVGSKAKLNYKNGMELIETITVMNLPHEFSGTYETKGVWNEVKNYFEEIDALHTKWTLDCVFKMESFFMRMLEKLLPFIFKAQTKSLMKSFKEFAETGKDVNNP